MESLKLNICLAPDEKMVVTKKVANDKEKSIWHHKNFWSFFVKKRDNLLFPRLTYDIVFSTKKMVLSANQSGIEKLYRFSPDLLA